MIPCKPTSDDTLVSAALKVLGTASPWLKAEYGALVAKLWQEGAIRDAYSPEGSVCERGGTLPDKPARDETIQIVAPGVAARRGKGGTLHSRQALLHSLCHIESWAIDLSWDIIARFGQKERMPREFFDDFVRVAAEEGRHFTMLAARLAEIGARYGQFPAHDGLWDSAAVTSEDLKGRLAVEHCVHEARGLDVLPQTISRFRAGGDDTTADLLECIIYEEEISHCRAGVRWFTYLCRREHEVGKQGSLEEGGPCSSLSIKESMGQSQLLSSDPQGGTPTPVVDELEPLDGTVPISTPATARDVIADLVRCRVSGTYRTAEEMGVARGMQEGEGRQAGGVLAAAPEGDGHLEEKVVEEFHRTVRKYFRGRLKPPFNEGARAAAGFGPQWYLPLAEC